MSKCRGWSHRQAAQPRATAQRNREADQALLWSCSGIGVRDIAAALGVSRMTAWRRIELGEARQQARAAAEPATCRAWVERWHLADVDRPWLGSEDHSHSCRRHVRPGARYCWQHQPAKVRARRMRKRHAAQSKHCSQEQAHGNHAG